jgi:flagellar protein FliO/FliZ
MFLTGTDTFSSVTQFLTVIIIFIFVLAITYFTTRWIATFQKSKSSGSNMESVEVYKISANKYLQIVKVGTKYLVLAVCKDTITMLTEMEEDQIFLHERKDPLTISFKDILDKAKNLKSKD